MVVASDFGDEPHLVRASEAGLIVINRAITRFDGVLSTAKKTGVSRGTIDKIKDRTKGVKYSTLKQLCDGLGINVDDVIDYGLTDSRPPCRDKRGRFWIKIEIDIELFKKEYGNESSITIADFKMDVKKIEEGCIKLTLEGNSDDVDRIVALVRSGELKELFGSPIQKAQALEIVGSEEIREAEDKWALIASIRADTSSSIRRNLAGKDLSDANLQGVYLVGANLSNADLSCVDLSGAKLSRADLRNAGLTEADLTGVDLHDAKLQGANLRDVTLDRSNLKDVTIDEKTIIDDKWKQVIQILENPRKFKDFSDRDLSMAKLIGVEWQGAKLRGTNLREVDFRMANLRRADFNRANLSTANLIDAELEGATFEAAEVRGAHFGEGRGLTDFDKSNLSSRGAIFNSSGPLPPIRDPGQDGPIPDSIRID